MSDRVQNKLKQLTLAKRTPRERMQSLIDCRMPSEGFTQDDIRELFGKHGSLILQLYQDFVALADTEATTKGKHLSTIEVGQLVQILKDLMLANAAKIVQSNWEVDFWQKELPCYLHQEVHIIVRRHGVDALATFISIRAASAAAGTGAGATTSDASLLPLQHLLLSALDWEYLRSTYGNVVSLPSTIIDVRRGRHDGFPPRARYSATAVGSDERHRETVGMLRRLLVDTIAEKDDRLATPDALALWSQYILDHVAPLMLPTVSLAAGLLRGATLHGFMHGVHPHVHPIFVDAVAQLAVRPDLVASRRLVHTLGATPSGTRLVLWILAEAIRNPCSESCPHIVKALAVLNLLLRQASSSSSSSSPDEAAANGVLPDARHHICEIVDNILTTNTIHLAAALLASVPPSSSSPPSAGGGGAIPLVGIYQSVVEAYAEWLMLLVTPSACIKGETDAMIPRAIKERAVAVFAVAASELAMVSVKKPSSHVDEVVAYVTQSFWASVVRTIPLYSERFVALLSPALHDMEERLATTSSSVIASPSCPTAYLVRCWVHLVHQQFRVFVAPRQGKLLPFSWPTPPVVPSVSAAAAATSPILEFRLKRTPVAVEWVTKSLVAAMVTTGTTPAPSSGAAAVSPPDDTNTPPQLQLADDDGGDGRRPTETPFWHATEAFHNLLFHFDCDTYATQRSKASITVDVIRTLMEASRSSSSIVSAAATTTQAAPADAMTVEPDSLLKIFGPYLLLQSRLTETSSSATVVSPSSTRGPPASVTTMSAVAKDALECLGDILALSTAERWATAALEAEPTSANIYNDDDDAAGSCAPPPITPVLLVVALDRLREALHACRNSMLSNADDVVDRIVVALFRSCTSTVVGKATASLFTNPQNALFSLMDEVEASCLAILETHTSSAPVSTGGKATGATGTAAASPQQRPPLASPASPAGASSLDAQIAALNGLVWTLSVDRRPEAPIDLRMEKLASVLQKLLEGSSKVPALHLAKAISHWIVLLLRMTHQRADNAAATAAVRARLQAAVVTLLDMLLASYNNLAERSVVSQLYGPVQFVIEALEDCLKHSTSGRGVTEVGSTKLVLSSTFFFVLYRRLLTALCGGALYHLHNWGHTQHTGDGLVQMLCLIAEAASRVGHLHLRTTHPDDEHYTVLLVQLVADVVGITQSGAAKEKYAVGFPSTLSYRRSRTCTVSRVESVYALMRDGLEAANAGCRLVTAGEEYTQVMVPPLDASARRWFGAATPAPTDVQAETLHPQQVVQAGIELYGTLMLHMSSFPHTTTTVTRPQAAGVLDPYPQPLHGVVERTVTFTAGHQQLLTFDTEVLDPRAVHLRASSVMQSNGWTIRPAPVRLVAATSDDGCDVATGGNDDPPAPAIVITRAAGRLEQTLEGLLEGFEGPCMPPKELVEYNMASAGGGSSVALGLSLEEGPRYSNARGLIGFEPARPPTADTAPVPQSECNHIFSFLLSIGAADGHEPLVKSVTASGIMADDGSSTATLSRAGVMTAALAPPEAYVPHRAATTGSVVTDALHHGVPTRSMVQPLPCITRSSPALPPSALSALHTFQDAVLSAFGLVSDDGMMTRAFTARHELAVTTVSTLSDAFYRSDAILCFVNTFPEIHRTTREIRALLSGRSFCAIYLMQSSTVRNAVVVHIARQGEGAPAFAPLMDGACVPMHACGLLLRAALLSSSQPWRQPVTVAEAKRRVSQRASRLFAIKAAEASALAALQTTPLATIGAGTPPRGSGIPLTNTSVTGSGSPSSPVATSSPSFAQGASSSFAGSGGEATPSGGAPASTRSDSIKPPSYTQKASPWVAHMSVIL